MKLTVHTRAKNIWREGNPSSLLCASLPPLSPSKITTDKKEGETRGVESRLSSVSPSVVRVKHSLEFYGVVGRKARQTGLNAELPKEGSATDRDRRSKQLEWSGRAANGAWMDGNIPGDMDGSFHQHLLM